jgi:hypothetical protein
MSKFEWKKIVIIFDLGIVFFTVLFFLYNFLKPVIYLSLRILDGGVFNIENANIFGILFVITLIKLLFGVICILILKIKYKQNIFMNNLKLYTILWILFSAMILSYSLVLIIMKAYNSINNLIYAIYIIIGNFCWIRVMVNNIYIKNSMKNIFVLFNLISNNLLIIIGYFISIY